MDILNQINRNIPELLNNSKHIAIVGLSNKPNRISYGVGSYLLQAGFNILPVNPNYDSILGLKCYPNLTEIPHSIDIVNIFRRSENVPSIVEEAISIKPKVIWMQLGIVNEQAAKLAIDSGLQVVMNRCIKIEHMLL
jgi:predicted CoA-binding protein